MEGLEQEWGEAAFLAMASRAQPGPAVSVEEERSCIPSCCQAAQTLLSLNSTWLEQFSGVRGGGGGSWEKEEGEAAGSYAKILPGCKGLAGLRKIIRLPPTHHLIHKTLCLGA